jgi:hypothetical protein
MDGEIQETLLRHLPTIVMDGGYPSRLQPHLQLHLYWMVGEWISLQPLQLIQALQ